MNLTRRFILPVLAAVLGGFTSPIGQARTPKRPCLQCGASHDHNNSFCSSGCCNTYRAIQRGEL